jgi:hypothetical protein
MPLQARAAAAAAPIDRWSGQVDAAWLWTNLTIFSLKTVQIRSESPETRPRCLWWIHHQSHRTMWAAREIAHFFPKVPFPSRIGSGRRRRIAHPLR